jgi:hypothetical protein
MTKVETKGSKERLKQENPKDEKAKRKESNNTKIMDTKKDTAIS